MTNILESNITAIFTLAGTVVGSLLSSFGSWIIKKRDLRDRMWEKVLDRRIAAHEAVIQVSKEIRMMVSLGRADRDGGLARHPEIMSSKEEFNSWRLRFSTIHNDCSTWLNNDLTRELNLLQDYFVNVQEIIGGANSTDFPEIGAFIADDFVDFSTKLEKLAFRFFARDLARQSLNSLDKWHKYPRGETYARLAATNLFKYKTDIEAAAGPKVVEQNPSLESADHELSSDGSRPTN